MQGFSPGCWCEFADDSMLKFSRVLEAYLLPLVVNFEQLQDIQKEGCSDHVKNY